MHLFSISEFARACGISRKTLIRMEECGFLTPAQINPSTGYRYYDAYNASEVGQYLFLQTLGLSRAEITEYYYNRGDIGTFLKQQKEKLGRMQRVLEELEIRNNPNQDIIFSFLELPEIVCYCEKARPSSPEEAEAFYYSVHEHCIEKGFRLDNGEPLFGMNSNDFKGGINAHQVIPEVTACIPVNEPADIDPHMNIFPATRAFSVLAYGDYSIIHELCLRFWQEIGKRRIKPEGPVRFIGIVAPYVGKHIDRNKFCYRLAVPISE